MDLNKLITERINQYALDGDADFLEKYGFLFSMIATDYVVSLSEVAPKQEQEETCDCVIPKPKSPFLKDEDSNYCSDCDGYINHEGI